MELERIIAVRNNKTIYREGKDCVKVFNEDFSKADVLNEALNQARIETIGLNIPRIKEVMTIEGKWAIVSEFIKGETLEQLMKKYPERKLEYLNLFIDIQMEIHSKQCTYLNKLRDKMGFKIGNSNLDGNVKYDLLTRLEGMERQKQVCHGDFNPSNIIITDDNKAYILDWSHVTQGNASADVARTYLIFWLNGEIELADEYLNLFSKKAEVDKRRFQKWMPIVAASQLTKSKEKEREFLLSWINVVDYE